MNGIKISAYVICLLIFTLHSCVSIPNALGQERITKKAQSLFDEGLKYQGYGEYKQAILLFQEAIKKAPGFLNAYDALANTYQKNNQMNEAKNTYLQLINLKPDHFFGLYELGHVFFELSNLDSSALYYKLFLDINKSNDKYAKQEELNLINISFSKAAMENPVDVTPINLGPSINTSEQEYSPAFAIDEKTIYITRRIGDLSDTRPNEDIYYSKKIDGNWQKIQSIGPPVNTIENEGAFSVSSDGNYIFFTSCSRSGGKGQCDLWITIQKNNTWSEPLNLQSPINTKYWESQPSISSDGKTLFFTSDRPGGYGGTDIWMAIFGENGWSEPVNLGPNINTSKDEQFPFIHADNQTLYFSSEGHPGMGKSDLFVSYKTADNTWEEPINLGYPINSNGFDWNLIVSRDGKTAYYSSDKIEGNGGLDIYTFELPEFIRAKQVGYLKGLVRDAKTKNPLSASIELTPLRGINLPIVTYAEDNDGVFLVPLKSNMQYALTIDKKGYLFHSECFNMPQVISGEPIEIYIDLEKIEIGNSVVLNNIFFDTDKYDLKKESMQELDKLLQFLKNNVTTQIEISGHTDNLGSSEHNLELSQNRAQSVYNYLINHAIDSNRIQFKGYGDQKPIVPNNSDENRAKNRRTEFKITQI